MATKRCPRGHFYNPDLHPSCPVCKEDKQIPTEVVTPPPSAPSSQTDTDVLPPRATPTPTPTPAPTAPPTPGTVLYKPGGKPSGNDGKLPVAGWLVIVDGPGTGRDFRLIQGDNRIGRDKDMEVCLDIGSESDAAISRDTHAVVLYDNNDNTFWVDRGASRNIPMLNGASIRQQQQLKAGDVLQIGATQMRFLPFCDNNFRW